MLGDAEHPISFRFAAERLGEHVRVNVWAGNAAAARGHAGALTFRVEEWAVLREALEVALLGDWIDGVATPGGVLVVDDPVIVFDS